jgi:hypothetical protein
VTARAGTNVRVVLKWVQILDKKEPFYESHGEFVFRARIQPDNDETRLVETRLPTSGHYSITDAAGENRHRLDVPIFEGPVTERLAIEVTGVELDRFSADDELNPYRRIFDGPPGSWIGPYGPGDERIEPEDLGDWRIWYRIEEQPSHAP